MKLNTFASFAAAPAFAAACQNATIRTTSGDVQGVPSEYVSSTITVFRGIPFGADTSGTNRFRRPQDPVAWNGTRVMSDFGPSCPQSNTVDEVSEDCLTLNIWVPPANTTSSSGPYPVYFWMYGGLNAQGAADLPVYDGAGLANKGVMVVTANYRKGIFGYLAHPDLTKESIQQYGEKTSGNYGMWDHLKALEWIKTNIANFGGNPDHVTIGGQSAGSAAVQQLLFSPMADGYFVGAISQSGMRYSHDPYIADVASGYIKTLSAAEEGGVDVSYELNATTVAAMRNLSMDTLISAQDTYDALDDGTAQWATNHDNVIFKYSYSEGIKQGNFSRVPVLTGNNKDESGASLTENITLYSGWQQVVAEDYLGLASEVFRLYPASNDSQADEAHNALARDNNKITTWLWANEYEKYRKQPVYQYYWTHGQPVADAASEGAFHGSEMNYVFNTMGVTYGQDPGALAQWTAEDYQLADRVSSYWANFIKTGSPNGDGLAYWPASSATNASTFRLGQQMYQMPLVDNQEKIALIEKYYAQNPAW